MRLLYIFLCGLSLFLPNFSQEQPSPPAPSFYEQQDAVIFAEKQKVASSVAGKSAQALLVAKSCLGVPYVTGTLEKTGPEELIVNLRQLDCWTFIESSLAVALTGQGDFQEYQRHLQQLRYWGGTVSGYGSRIHYFSGWILQGQGLGYLRDVTADLGGMPYRKKIGYISARPQKYPHVQDPATQRALLAAEARINRHAWSYIPKSKVAQIESQIQEGDLILLTSVKPDLDIAHQGFAIRKNGRIYLLHASSLHKRVVISA